MQDTQDVFQELEEQFSKRSAELTQLMQEVLQFLPDGKAPDEKHEWALYNAIHDLRVLQTSYQKETEKVLANECTVPEGASLSEMRALREEMQDREQIRALRAVLSQFCSVSAGTPAYTELLEPYQKEAQQHIARMDNGEKLCDEFIKAAEGPRVFLRALAADPMSAQGQQILTSDLVPYYSGDLRIGFFVGAYSLPEGTEPLPEEHGAAAPAAAHAAKVPAAPDAEKAQSGNAAAEDAASETPPETAAPAADATPEQKSKRKRGRRAKAAEQPEDVPKTEAADAAASPESEETAAKGPLAAASSEAAAAPEPAKPKKKTKRVKAAAAESTPAPEPEAHEEKPAASIYTGELICATNKVRPAGKAKASTFKDGLFDLGRTFHDIPSLVQLMGALGAASVEAICGIGRHAGVFQLSSDEEIAAAIMSLVRRGWAANFEYEEPDGTKRSATGLSEYSAASMQKETVASFLKRVSILQGCHVVGYGAEEDKAIIRRGVEDADALLYYLTECEDSVRRRAFRPEMPAISWTTTDDDLQYCTVSIQLNDMPLARCQLLHSGSDLSLVRERYVLYVIRPEEEVPGPEFADKLGVGVILFKEGEYSVLHGSDGLYSAPVSTSDLSDGARKVAEAVQSSAAGGKTTDRLAEPEELEHVASPARATAIARAGQGLLPGGTRPARARTRGMDKQRRKAALSAFRIPPLGEDEQASAAEEPEEEIRTDLDVIVEAALSGEAPETDVFSSAATSLLLNGGRDDDRGQSGAVRGVLLAKSASLIPDRDELRELSAAAQLATGLFIDDLSYSSTGLEAAFPDPSKADPALLYCSYALALLMPDAANDYLLRSRARDLFSRYEEIFPRMPEFKTLFRTLLDLWDRSTGGFSASVMALLGTNTESEGYVVQIRNQAKDYLRVVPPTTQLKPLVPMYNAAFGPGSDLYQSMDIIARDVRHKLPAVERVLAKFCDPGAPDALVLSEERIEQDLEAKWEKASSKNFSLAYVAKDKAIRNYRDRLELMVAWVRHIQTLASWPKEMAVIKKMRDKILRDLGQIDRKKSWTDQPHAGIMQHLVTRMREHLTNHEDTAAAFAEVLKTGRFSLDDRGVPVFDAELAEVSFFEPWRHAAEHIRILSENPDRTYDDACAEILDTVPGGPEGLMDNLHQLETMEAVLGEEAPRFQITEELREATKSAAEESTHELEAKLDSAYMRGQINAEEQAQIAGTLQQFEERFFAEGNFANWRWFLGALGRQIDTYADKRIDACMARIEAIRAQGGNSAMLDRAERALTEDRNFTVAEETLNRHESGNDQWVPDDLGRAAHPSFFDDFRDTAVFQPLLDECRRNGEGRGSISLKTFGTAYLKQHKPDDWTVRHMTESEEFLQNWPGGKGTPPEQVMSFMQSLGFDATGAVLSQQKGNVEVFEVSVSAVPRGKKDYAHPIAAFGTRMESPINVVAIYGKCIEDQLVETMRELDFDDISLVLLDYHMDPGQRRRLAEIFYRQTQGQNRYLVVDRVLALYLAFRKSTERLKAMLQCTLPYTACQPFGSDGGATPDEMFCGRESELASIMSPDGASIVYGGRQLGKTALLQRAQSRFHTPAKRRYAMYTNIQRYDTEEKLAARLAEDIRAATEDAVDITGAETLADLSEQLQEAFRDGRVSSMLLLLDEADPLLAGIEQNAYRELQPLVELRQATQNRFKFVLAGLHNVWRAERAMANNGVFGQLGTPLCIRPLSMEEASTLLARPLRYLGFEIPERQLETLTTNSNFYPGVLQFIGHTLVETLPDHYRKSCYSAVANPPFGLDDGLLGTVLKNRDLNASIKSKVRGTLELDPRYFMAARTVALLCILDEEADGYTVQDIREIAKEYKVACLSRETLRSLTTLLDEMVDMGIFVMRDDKRYRFRRDSFKDIVGTDADALEAALRGSEVTV